MRKFRKSQENKFICEECKEFFNNLNGLSRHVNKIHGNIKIYYDKWIKLENEGTCKICKNETIFKGFYWRYKNTCSTECENKYRNINRINSFIKNHGVKNPYELKKIKEKIKTTKEKKYGDPNFNNRDKASKTNEEIYGGHPMTNQGVKRKKDQTCLAKYGTKCSLLNTDVKNKTKQTNIKRYGTVYPMQNIKIYLKQQKSTLKISHFEGSKLYYQGSYELDFLEKYYHKYPDLERGKSIKYIFEKQKKYYYPDFYIPSKNLIIEIKSSYYHNKFIKRDIEKIKATISNGFQYLMILDKEYSEFENL